MKTNSEALQALLETVEAAKEKDRFVDLDLEWLILSEDEKEARGWHRYIRALCDREGGRALAKLVDTSKRPSSQADYVPYYTRDTDAAIALFRKVLPLFRMEILETDRTQSYDPLHGFTVELHPTKMAPRGEKPVDGFGETIALALVAAVIRYLVEKNTAIC